MYHVIINPSSRSGKGERVWSRVKRELMCRGIRYQAYRTTYRGHAAEIAALLTEKKRWNSEDVLLIVGGDGTLNEAVNGICRLSEVVLGYIPTGSGNDFARGMGIPSDAGAALAAVLAGKSRSICVGKVSGGGWNRRFVISSGIGYDADVCRQANASPLKRILNRLHLGKFTYCVIGLRQLFSFRTCTLELTLDDGSRKHYDRVLFTAFMNLPFEGGGFRFCPQADPADGKLDVMVVAGLEKWKIVLLFPTAFFGVHTFLPQVHILRCSRVTAVSDLMEPIHVDGESGARGTHRMIETEEEMLRVLCPHGKGEN